MPIEQPEPSNQEKKDEKIDADAIFEEEREQTGDLAEMHLKANRRIAKNALKKLNEEVEGPTLPEGDINFFADTYGRVAFSNQIASEQDFGGGEYENPKELASKVKEMFSRANEKVSGTHGSTLFPGDDDPDPQPVSVSVDGTKVRLEDASR